MPWGCSAKPTIVGYSNSDDTATKIAGFHGCSSQKRCVIGFDPAPYHWTALSWNHMGQTGPPTCEGPITDMSAQERHHLAPMWGMGCTMLCPSHVDHFYYLKEPWTDQSLYKPRLTPRVSTSYAQGAVGHSGEARRKMAACHCDLSRVMKMK